MTNKNISIFGKQSQQEKEFWLNKLTSEEVSHLLLDHERSNTCPPHNERVEVSIPADTLAKLAKLAGRSGLTKPGSMKARPKKRKLCRVAIARWASNGSIALRRGQI